MKVCRRFRQQLLKCIAASLMPVFWSISTLAADDIVDAPVNQAIPDVE